MNWLRRYLVPLMVVLLVLAFFGWHRWHKQHLAAATEKYARVTAQLWVATATYRQDQQGYLKYRDSLMEANDISADEVDEYLRRWREEPERYDEYASRVSQLVDSLLAPARTVNPDTASASRQSHK